MNPNRLADSIFAYAIACYSVNPPFEDEYLNINGRFLNFLEKIPAFDYNAKVIELCGAKLCGQYPDKLFKKLRQNIGVCIAYEVAVRNTTKDFRVFHDSLWSLFNNPTNDVPWLGFERSVNPDEPEVTFSDTSEAAYASRNSERILIEFQKELDKFKKQIERFERVSKEIPTSVVCISNFHHFGVEHLIRMIALVRRAHMP